MVWQLPAQFYSPLPLSSSDSLSGLYSQVEFFIHIFSPQFCHALRHQDYIIRVQYFLYHALFYLVRNNIDDNVKQQWWQSRSMMYSNLYLKLFRKMCTNFHFCPCSFAQAHLWCNKCFFNTPLSHWPFKNFPWNSIKCFFRSKKHMYNFFCLPMYSSYMRLKMKTASIVHVPGIKPNCISSIATIVLNVFSSTVSTTFIACSSSLHPMRVTVLDISFAFKNRNCNTGSPVFWHSFSI